MSERGDETINHLITALDLGYISQTLYDEMRSLANEVRRLLNGYIKYLKHCRRGEREPGRELAVHEVRITYEIPEQLSTSVPD